MGMATYAVVDLETTGNQLDFDDIIQNWYNVCAQ